MTEQSPVSDFGELRRMGVIPSMTVGAVFVLAFFGGFGAWAAFAPLDSAAIALGTLAVESRRKTVQHLEGGIVGEILVDEGTVVEAGQPLIRLDTTQARIGYELFLGRHRSAAAQGARLAAERDGLDAIVFPDWLSADASVPNVAAILAGEERIFAARRDAIASAGAILQQRILQLEEEIDGLERQIAAQNRELGYINEEISTVQSLLDEGLATRPRLLALQREGANIDGERARFQAAIARAGQRIGEAQLEIDDLGTAKMNAVVQELRDVETRIADLRERIAAARDVLERTEIVAPVSGTVVGLQVFTSGGVIGPGTVLMEIVPTDDPLIIEARVAPNDIDVVHPGQVANVKFLAFSQRRTPSFTGQVLQVSADLLIDGRSGQAYYLARISIDEDQDGLEELNLYPGMQAEVLIKTGERTAIEYLLEPLTSSMNRALRED
ncbi:MAG: HlyD family type I secretion periplasmic adaptor subunit [Alphaproteobacteria bacterium]|nr:HlyD family type I secretion periplasmic adaptor subunit [Alphaproteobacteria bacterium]